MIRQDPRRSPARDETDRNLLKCSLSAVCWFGAILGFALGRFSSHHPDQSVWPVYVTLGVAMAWELFGIWIYARGGR